VLGACEREGSLDSAIRNPAANDFARLRELCPALETVGFNGQTSGRFAPGFAAAGYRTCVLPSTSPAHASLTFAEKLRSEGIDADVPVGDRVRYQSAIKRTDMETRLDKLYAMLKLSSSERAAVAQLLLASLDQSTADFDDEWEHESSGASPMSNGLAWS
jgi:hypothetical protein